MLRLARFCVFGTNVAGTLPSSWSGMKSLQQLKLTSNSIGGTLPPSWANMTSLTQLHCDDVVSHTMSESISESASRSDFSATAPSTEYHSTASESRSRIRILSSFSRPSPSPSQWVCNVSGGTVLVQLVPPVAMVGDGEPTAFVVSLESSDVVDRERLVPSVRIATNSIPRATLTTRGLWIAMNVSISTPGNVANRWVVGGVTMLGEALNWTVQSSNTVPWSLIVLRTPVGGWLDASVSLLADETLDFVVTMLCDGAEILEVSVVVPAPGVPRVYAEEIATVGRC
ncbi:GP46-like surface antigen, putative, partial [Bodo saltans]